jgi:signal transduction histidine kinase
VNTPLLKNIQELETKYGLVKKQREILQKNLLLEQKERETQRQRQWLIATGAGMVLLALLVLLIYRFYSQKQQLNTKALQVLKAEQESGRLKAVLEGEQQERRRISQELHDDMGAGLTRMLFLSRTISTSKETSGKIAETAQDLIIKMNEVIWTMSDEQDTLDSLVAYIRSTAADMLETAGLNYTFKVKEPIGIILLNRQFRRNVYLAVKEAVHNVIKHAAASNVQIVISNNGKLDILVQDDGKGFDDKEQRRLGNGMKNMQSRVQQLNGSMETLSKEGIQVRFVVPLPL